MARALKNPVRINGHYYMAETLLMLKTCKTILSTSKTSVNRDLNKTQTINHEQIMTCSQSPMLV